MPSSNLVRTVGAIAFGAVLLLANLHPNSLEASSPTTERISIRTGGIQANNPSEVAAVSASGRFVAFQSSASNLVSGDTNATGDIFVRDRTGGTTERVSVASGGQESNANSTYPSISSDGRFVAFASDASNLVPADLNGVQDIFVRDRTLAQTIRVSVDSAGNEADHGGRAIVDISPDGRYVLFDSSASNLVFGDTNGWEDVFLHDMQTGVTALVSLGTAGVQGNSNSYTGAMSGDARFIAYVTTASNLVPNDTNNAYDIFVRDTLAATTTRVSVDSDGFQGDGHSVGPTISGDGRYVAFLSSATQLIPDDLNADWDVFVHDRFSGQTFRVSVDSSGNGANTNGNGSAPAAISSNGRYVAFSSGATNLVPFDTNAVSDIFVHDITTGATERVSLTSAQGQSNNASYNPGISGDGNVVAFHSDATNLVLGDTNAVRDVFARDRGLEGATVLGGIDDDPTLVPLTSQDSAPWRRHPMPHVLAAVAVVVLVLGIGGSAAWRRRQVS